MNPAYGYALALLIGASGAWYVQGIRWDNDLASIRHGSDAAISANVDAMNQQLIASREQTETIRATFIEYKTGKENETSALERAVADSTKRLRVAAHCSTVPANGATPGGASSGTAELEPAARQDYYTLRRAADRQYADLKFCRSELKKRSAQ